MFIEFSEISSKAKVWIYQASDHLSQDDIIRLSEEAKLFCSQWTAHNTPLQASFKVLHEKFLVLAVDEGVNAASGCSIDSSVRFVKTIEQALGVNFFDRTQVAFLIDDHVYTTGLQSIKDEISKGKIEPETLTFNLQAQNVAEFNENWLLPVNESWMKRYF